MVTAQELENAKIDARTIGESVNENKIVTPRYGVPFKSMPMIAEEMQSVIGTIIGGGVPSSIVLDASGKTQQEINDSVNNSIIAASPSGITDRGAALTSYLNALPRYSSVKIPNGDYYFNGSLGSRVVSNSLNIDASGVTFLMSPTVSGAPVLEIRNPDAVAAYPAATVLNSLSKNDFKLNVKSTSLLDNPTDYFVVVTSTEVANPRVGYASPYYKNITLDLAQNDYTFRDKLPFSFNDLSLATVTFVKKSRVTTIKGLKIKPTAQNANYNTWLQFIFLNNVKFEDLTFDFSEFPSFGITTLINKCCNLTFNRSDSYGVERDSNDSYAFMNSISSYLYFNNCSSKAKLGTTKPNRGYIARHGFMIKFDGCLLGGIDDHWGYDYTVDKCNLGGGIQIAGGSLTVNNTRAGGILVNLREDTPHCDGTLKIRNSYGANGILKAYGHTTPQANTGVYGSHKVWDIIDIDVDCSSDDFTASPIIIKEPRQNQTDVYRDTILKLTGCYKMIEASRPLLQEWHQDNNAGAGETGWYTDLESKRLFSVIDVNVKVFVKNGVETGRAPLIDAILAKNITLKSNHATFDAVRSTDVFTIEDSKISESKQTTLGYIANELNVNNVNLIGSPSFFNRGSTHKVFIQGGRIENQNRFVTMFGSNLEACNGTSYEDESFKAIGNLSLRNYRKGLTVIYTTVADITLADGVSSTQLVVTSLAFNINQLIVGTIVFNGVVVDVYRRTEAEYDIRFKLRNISGSSVTIPTGTKVIIKAVG